MEDRIHTPRPLAGLIDYQDGSIVSKVLLKKRTGNVTLFALDKGEVISEHTTPFDAMVQCLEGELEVRIGGDRHGLTAHDLIIMPANIPHALTATGRAKMLLTLIRE